MTGVNILIRQFAEYKSSLVRYRSILAVGAGNATSSHLSHPLARLIPHLDCCLKSARGSFVWMTFLFVMALTVNASAGDWPMRECDVYRRSWVE